MTYPPSPAASPTPPPPSSSWPLTPLAGWHRPRRGGIAVPPSRGCFEPLLGVLWPAIPPASGRPWRRSGACPRARSTATGWSASPVARHASPAAATFTRCSAALRARAAGASSPRPGASAIPTGSCSRHERRRLPRPRQARRFGERGESDYHRAAGRRAGRRRDARRGGVGGARPLAWARLLCALPVRRA